MIRRRTTAPRRAPFPRRPYPASLEPALRAVLVATTLLATLGGRTAVAQPANASDDPLARRTREIADAVCDGLADPAAYFAPAFLSQVPPAQITQILQRFCAEGGAVTDVVEVERRGDTFAEYTLLTAKGKRFPVKIGILPEAPHLVHTLWFGALEDELASWDELLRALDELPGDVSFAAWELGDGEPGVVAETNPERRLGVGSAFKLYVLGAATASVAAGEHDWAEIVPLRRAWRSLPSGVLQNWPVGSPVTLHTLALQMIALSDNTATDHLIRTLGREKVESILPVMGHGDPALDRPFLTTREMFLLKADGKEAERLRPWREGDEAARRRLLDALDAVDLSQEVVSLPRPTGIDYAEWFASAGDLCRALDHLRRAGDDDTGAPPLDLLAVNPGLPGLATGWDYAGFKGGSEPGVLALAWLLHDDGGRWYALTIVWNDATAPLEEHRLYGLMPAAARLLARR